MRPVDADALEEKAKQYSLGYYEADEWAVPLCEINEAPSIDIEPKRGEWKPFDLTWGRRIWYCTACEESTEVPCDIWEHKPIYKYCPNCGADMRKESE